VKNPKSPSASSSNIRSRLISRQKRRKSFQNFFVEIRPRVLVASRMPRKLAVVRSLRIQSRNIPPWSAAAPTAGQRSRFALPLAAQRAEPARQNKQ
jgi:hypothetical protein